MKTEGDTGVAPSPAPHLTHKTPPSSGEEQPVHYSRSLAGGDVHLPPPTTTPLRIGNTKLKWGTRLYHMTDSSAAYANNDTATLRARLAVEGYLLVRGAVATDTALKARKALLHHLAGKQAVDTTTDGDANDAGGNVDDDEASAAAAARVLRGRMNTQCEGFPAGWCVDAQSGGLTDTRETAVSYDAWRSVGRSTAVTDVYNGDDIHRLWSTLFHDDGDGSGGSSSSSSSSRTRFLARPDCTWLRMKGRRESTVEHADYYYFKHSTRT
jgi:hypothetical protein